MNMFVVRFGIQSDSLARRLAAPVFGAMLTAIVLSPTARAQLPGNGPAGTNHMIPRTGGTAEKPALAAPDAIPGSKPRDDAAPATRAASDMQPTDALFDAINRGDIAAARDALNRGADQNGVNVLGMTPMELSVDLGRNDISFLLLSMRGEDSGRGSRAVSHDSASAGPRPAATAKPTVPKVVAETPVAPKPKATPKLFANDGGTPIPSAGFLGFGARPAAN